MEKTKEQKEQEKAQRQAKMQEKRNLENAQKINAQNLGRIARLVKDCTTDIEKNTILTVQARRYQTTSVALSTVLETYINKVKESGKLETRIAMLANVQATAFEKCQVDNAILALDAKEIPNLAKDVLVNIVSTMHIVNTKLVNLLHSNDGTTSPTQGYCVFLHSPLKNLFTDTEIEKPEFYLVSQGWDGKRNFPYYGVRMTPSDNPKNTREVHCQRPSPVEFVGIATNDTTEEQQDES